MAEKHVPQLRIKLEGPAVGPARLAARDLAKLVQKTEQALKRIGQVLYGQASGGRGRNKKDIEELCSLDLVSWEQGSAIAGFDFAEVRQLSFFPTNVGEQSLETFLAGLADLSRDADEAFRTPVGFDLGILETCEAYSDLLKHGIDTIGFSAPRSDKRLEVTYTARTRDAIRAVLRRPLDHGRSSKVGRLEALNGHDALTGTLWEADGTRWTCYFKPEHLEVLAEAWLKTVTIVGEAVLDGRSRRGELTVDTILIEEGVPFELVERVAGEAFWRSTSLEELAATQEIGPVTQLAGLAAHWPPDDVPDDPFADLVKDRLERRRSARHDLM